jgi:hypothetical protein
MNKYPLIGGSICAVVLLVLASLTNVVGYQTAQASNQKMINTEIDQKELLFQTIVDMTQNKEIQRVIFGTELAGKWFVNPDMDFVIFNLPIVTEKFLKRAYTMGVVLSRALSKSMIDSMVKRYQGKNQTVQKEIAVVIEKDTMLKTEMARLTNLSCGCDNGNTTWFWPFPIICTILIFLINFFSWLGDFIPYPLNFVLLIPILYFLSSLAIFLQCS